MRNVAVTVIGREACHLCDDATDLITVVLEDFTNVSLEKRLVEEDPAWLEFYTDKVPVILIDGVEHGYWRVNEGIFRGALMAAGALSHEKKSE
ncbi:MAG: glutaredoxin family protein [Microbacteriaceae bacterium]|nr:glutaredoxin family protein [Microbacteriaceae bacterium]